MCSWLSPLRLGMHQEPVRGGRTRPVQDGEAGRGSGGWGYSPVVLLGVAIAAGNAHLVCSWFPWMGIQWVEQRGADHR